MDWSLNVSLSNFCWFFFPFFFFVVAVIKLEFDPFPSYPISDLENTEEGCKKMLFKVKTQYIFHIYLALHPFKTAFNTC